MYKQYQLEKITQGRGIYDLTSEIRSLINDSGVKIGLSHIFLLHTSASLIICENDDSQVQVDLENFMSQLIPDGYPLFKHIAEGPDDMSSHVRTILTSTFLTVPITDYKLMLGRWQGLYLWEHRINSHHRKMIITISGE